MPVGIFGRGVLATDPIDQLTIPNGTEVQEHDLVTDGDVLIGGGSTVEFGLRGRSLVAGERVSFNGDIEMEGDCRLDMWCEADGNILVGEDAYLGERVSVTGRLVVGGDLDIGDDVDIEEGFEANGWIVIRNPMPTVVFFMIYLTHLLRLGEAEEAESLVEELSANPDMDPVRIPHNATVSDDVWRVSTPATVGNDCRLHGNIRAEEITVGEDNDVFGSLRARGDITVGSGTTVHGDVTTRNGNITVQENATVLGDVSGTDVILSRDADVDGTIRATGAMQLDGTTEREPE
ncbi:acyltransferase [Halodesulfurarchaeum sp.]|uniref:acyltransferase n=1 Tax=Halodesulfurarchaeum sp. TaxID=1980530 RepID=UPI001BBBBEC3|nr:polymer-forming cytoskeletal protein [Halodesulfurarchaeum sp.]